MTTRRSNIELQGIAERVVELYVKGKHIADIADMLREEGYKVSAAGVCRHLKGWREAAEDYQKSMAEADALIAAVKNGANSNCLEGAASLLAGKLFAKTKDIEEIDTEDVGEMVEMLGDLALAQSRLVKLRLQFQNGFEAGKKAVLDQFAVELRAHPDLVERLSVVVNGLKPPE